MQDPLLFPHLSVAANVAFSPRSSRAGARRVGWPRSTPRIWPTGCRGSCPAGRPSGSRWRARWPPNPMCCCSTSRWPDWTSPSAAAMRKLLRRVLARDGRSAVLITHDLLDVLTLADRVLVIEAGRIVETGSTATVLAAPRSRFGARFAGVNLVDRHGGRRRRADDAVGDGLARQPRHPTWRAGQPAVAVFPPAAVAVYRDKPHGSPRNTVEVTVAELDSRGPAIRVRADEQPDGVPGLAADITADSAAELRLAPGERVYFSVKAQEVTLHPSP